MRLKVANSWLELTKSIADAAIVAEPSARVAVEFGERLVPSISMVTLPASAPEWGELADTVRAATWVAVSVKSAVAAFPATLCARM